MTSPPDPLHPIADRLRSTSQFYEEEDLLAKIQELERLERSSHYRNVTGGVWKRMQAAVRTLDEEFREAALALFSSTIYLDEPILDSALRLVIAETGKICRDRSLDPSLHAHILCVDHQDMVEKFYQLGPEAGWTSRQSNKLQLNIRTCKQLLQALHSHQGSHNHDLTELFQRKIWFLVTDNALGGGSVRSDLRRLNELLILLDKKDQIEIFLCCELLSTQAIALLNPLIERTNIIYGLLFTDEFQIPSPRCKLFHDPSQLQAVRHFCEHFSRKHFEHPHENFKDTITAFRARKRKEPYEQLHFEWETSDFAFGWDDCGFTIVTHRNAPTNSVPALWYPCLAMDSPDIPYIPPFPRSHSRFTQTITSSLDRSPDDNIIDDLRQNRDRLKRELGLP